MNLLFQQIIRPSRMRYRSRFLFSISKEQLTQKHQAILASNIIKKILDSSQELKKRIENFKAHQNQSFRYSSLRSQIIEMIKQYQAKKNIQAAQNQPNQLSVSIQTAKKNIQAIFDGGVWLDENLCVQKRFVSQQSSKIQQSTKFKKISFCPTYAVTGKIFKLIKINQDPVIIKGHYGIGKTYSFMLYHLLSDIVYRYLHKNYKLSGLNIDGKKVDFPKLVYWSIDMESFKRQENETIINKLIAKQCYQLTSIHPSYDFIHHLENKQIDCQNFYIKQKEMNVKVAIDQIHVIASAFRIYKNFRERRKVLFQRNQPLETQLKKLKKQKIKDEQTINQIRKKIKKNDDQIQYLYEQQKKFKPIYDKAVVLLNIAQTLRNKFGSALFLSSKTIQTDQMKALNLNGQITHSWIDEEDIKFMKFQEISQTYSDLAEFFVMLLQIRYRQINEKELTENQKNFVKKIKNIFFEKINEINSLIFPLAMRYIIFKSNENPYQQCSVIMEKIIKSNEPNNKKQNQKQAPIQIENQIDKIAKIMNKRSIQKIVKLVENFLQKKEDGDHQVIDARKKIALLKLLYTAKSIILQRRFDPEAPLKQISISQKDIFGEDYTPSETQIKKNFDGNLAYFEDNGKIIFTVKQEVIVQVLEKYQKDLLRALLQNNQQIYSLIRGKCAKGLYFESNIFKGLSKKGTIIKIKKFRKDNLYRQELFGPMSTDKIHRFYSIPFVNSPLYGKFSFLKAFKQLIKNNQGGCFLSQPVKQTIESSNSIRRKKKQKKYDETSKKIDFVLTQILPKSNSIYITAVDATKLRKGQALLKFSDFLYEFSNFVDRQQQKIEGENDEMNVELAYYVLVPKIRDPYINWEQLIKKAIKQLQQEIKSGKQVSKQMIDRLNDRKSFLNKLLQTEESKKNELNNNKSLTFKNIEINGKQLLIKRDNLKTLLTKIALVEFKQIENETSANIALEKAQLQLIIQQESKEE